MIVVADTSVILNLCRVQQERLLHDLFGRVVVPAEVAVEFNRLSAVEVRFNGLVMPGWIEVNPGPQIISSEINTAHLDAGESAAITLAILLAADALLVDEKLGREVARRLGLPTIGILGVLIEARRRGLIPSIKSVLDPLETEAGFWVARSLRQQVLRLAGE